MHLIMVLVVIFTVDGKENPVAFVSKSLSKTKLRWATIQKEAYAIFYTCTFLKSLLRDREFTINTDHNNLLSISQNSNPMIIRWLMALSEFSFKVKFIAGKENEIADSMSPLCRNNMVDFSNEYSTAAEENEGEGQKSPRLGKCCPLLSILPSRTLNRTTQYLLEDNP